MSVEKVSLESVAGVLDALTTKADARMYFEVMSGGLVWTDEYPPRPPDGVYYDGEVEIFPTYCLRGIWGFRASLVRGMPNERCRSSWEKGLELFPNWPGFLPERRDAKWREFLDRETERTANALEDLDERWRRQHSAASIPRSAGSPDGRTATGAVNP